LFLFFGWFHKTKLTDTGYRFLNKNDSEDFYDISDLHVIYGYMQIDRIITQKEEIKKYKWHPHALTSRLNQKSNALYVPRERLSFNPLLPGYGTLDYRKDRVLTMEGKSRATWAPHKFLMPNRVYGNKKNSAKKEGLYYAGIWQELIVEDTPELWKWVNSLLS
jgi:hypothetical protein